MDFRVIETSDNYQQHQRDVNLSLEKRYRIVASGQFQLVGEGYPIPCIMYWTHLLKDTDDYWRRRL